MPSVGRLCTEFFYAITPSIFPSLFVLLLSLHHVTLCLDMLHGSCCPGESWAWDGMQNFQGHQI